MILIKKMGKEYMGRIEYCISWESTPVDLTKAVDALEATGEKIRSLSDLYFFPAHLPAIVAILRLNGLSVEVEE